MRRGLKWWATVFALQLMMTWVSATSRLLEPNDGRTDDPVQPSGDVVVVGSELSGTESSLSSIEHQRNRVLRKEHLGWGKKGQAVFKESKKIGSKPPNCNSKCYGCDPCVAIQVPAAAASRISLQYANYLPEGWKCRCGPSFYSP